MATPHRLLDRSLAPSQSLNPYSSIPASEGASTFTDFSRSQTILSKGDSASENSRSNSRTGSTLFECEGAIDPTMDSHSSDYARIQDRHLQRTRQPQTARTHSSLQQASNSFIPPLSFQSTTSNLRDLFSDVLGPDRSQSQQPYFVTASTPSSSPPFSSSHQYSPQSPLHSSLSSHPLSSAPQQRQFAHTSNTISSSSVMQFSSRSSRRHGHQNTDATAVSDSPLPRVSPAAVARSGPSLIEETSHIPPSLPSLAHHAIDVSSLPIESDNSSNNTLFSHKHSPFSKKDTGSDNSGTSRVNDEQSVTSLASNGGSGSHQTLPEIVIQFPDSFPSSQPTVGRDYIPHSPQGTFRPKLLQSLLSQEHGVGARPDQENSGPSKRIISIPSVIDLSTLHSQTHTAATGPSPCAIGGSGSPLEHPGCEGTGNLMSSTSSTATRSIAATPTTAPGQSWGWSSLRRKNMPCQSDIPSSSPQAEHLYDEEAQQQQYPSAPSPTLYSPHSPFTPKTLSSDEPQPPVQKQQQQKYDSLRSTFSSDSSAATNTAVNTPLFASVAQRAKGRGSFRVHGAGVAAHSDDDLPMQSNGSDGFSRGRGEAFSSSTAGPSSPTELRKLMKPTSMLFESSQLPEKSENGKKYITRKKKNKDPSKEAFKINKTLFSNERTFVHWLKFGMLLGGLAMTLLNFSTLSADASIAMGGGGGGSGNNGVGGLGPFGIGTGHAPSKAAPHSGSLNTTETPATKNPEVVAMAIWLGKVGQYVGAFLLLVCMGCLAYSTALFHWRHLGIAKKATDRRYYDRWGPTILTVLLVTVYTVNVYLTMKATSGHESNHQPTPLYNVHPVIGPPTPSESPFVPSPTNINKTGSDGTAGEDGVWAMNPYDTPTPTSRLGPSDAAATAASVPDPASSYDSSSSYDDTEYGYNDEDDDEEEDDEDEERW